MTTGFVFHELYLWHNTGNAAMVFPSSLSVQPGEHVENPETKRRLKNLLEEIELADQVGLDVFGIGEHHRPDFVASSPVTILAAAAARTQACRRCHSLLSTTTAWSGWWMRRCRSWWTSTLT